MTDIIGFRVILDNVDECYKALGVFIVIGTVFLVNSKIIYPLQKLIIINHCILQ